MTAVPTIKQRHERIEALLAAGPRGITLGSADSDAAHADRAYLIGEVDRLEAGIKKAIEACEGCGGTGFDVVDDGHGDIDKDPCQFCFDLRDLIKDHTNYPLARAQAAAPPAQEHKVVPFVRCTKLEFCSMAEGHAGECDDIPF